MNFGRLPLDFDRPAFLALVAVVPLFWLWGRGGLVGLGRWRAALAFGLRALLWLLLVAACAEMQWVRTDDRLTVIYVLDRSLSVPEPQRKAMIEYVNRSIEDRKGQDDLVGVIAFGREARTEAPPAKVELHLPAALETSVDPQYTNLAEALRLAQASFPEDSARRIVIVSDGNSNLGDVYAEARQAAEQGIGVDVVPVKYQARGEVLVEKVSLPAIARRGEPFDVQVLLNNVGRGDGAAAPVGGTLELLRRRGDRTTLLSRQKVELPAGKRPFAVRQTLEDADFYVYEAVFTPDDPQADTHVLNNKALNFTQLEGSGRILFIENFQRRGRHDRLIEALRREKLEVVVMPSSRLFESPAELIAFDTVIIADVPRSGGENADDVVTFSDEQVRMLASNVQDMGCGLVMLGGPNSFGAGGWANSAVEAAMPVDFQIKNVNVVPSGALALVIDSSGSMSGQKLDMARQAAVAAVRVLSSKDFLGVCTFDSISHWIVPMHQVQSIRAVVDKLGRITSGGGTNMQPAIAEAYESLQKTKASVKHLIALTDGMTEGSGYEKQAAEMKRQGITTTTVAIGDGAADKLLDDIARAGGGKFYMVKNPRAIPKIFMMEALRIARPLLFEKPEGFAVRRESSSHEILRGIDGELPPLTGFVLTQRKSSPLVTQLITNPTFAAEGTGTIAAAWTYGLGRTAVWTTDAGGAWAQQWNAWPQFDRLLTSLIRWTMRPPVTSGRFTVHADVQDGQGRMVVTAVDEAGEYVNLLDPQGTVVGPDLVARPIQLEQTAPGRYAASFDTENVGSYFLVVRPGPGQPALRAGVNVSYSPELRDREPNLAMLDGLAALKARGGGAGILAPPLTTAPAMANVAGIDFFRHDLPPASGRRDLWPELVLAAVIVFVFDVFLRRVAFDMRMLLVPFAALRTWWSRQRGLVPAVETMQRLKSRKQEVVQQVEQRRATVAARPTEAARPASKPIAEAARSVDVAAKPQAVGPTSPTASSSAPPAAPEEAGYTSRLLAAKRKMWQDRQSGAPPDPSSSENPPKDPA